MAKGDTRWQQMHFSLTDFISTMLHRLDFRLKFDGIAILFRSCYYAATTNETTQKTTLEV